MSVLIAMASAVWRRPMVAIATVKEMAFPSAATIVIGVAFSPTAAVVIVTMLSVTAVIVVMAPSSPAAAGRILLDFFKKFLEHSFFTAFSSLRLFYHFIQLCENFTCPDTRVYSSPRTHLILLLPFANNSNYQQE